jgi:hypothetical protein
MNTFAISDWFIHFCHYFSVFTSHRSVFNRSSILPLSRRIARQGFPPMPRPRIVWIIFPSPKSNKWIELTSNLWHEILHWEILLFSWYVSQKLRQWGGKQPEISVHRWSFPDFEGHLLETSSVAIFISLGNLVKLVEFSISSTLQNQNSQYPMSIWSRIIEQAENTFKLSHTKQRSFFFSLAFHTWESRFMGVKPLNAVPFLFKIKWEWLTGRHIIQSGRSKRASQKRLLCPGHIMTSPNH